MARIFSINFPHQGEMQNALISVRNNHSYTEYKIEMIRDELLKLLPDNKIISMSSKHFVFPNATTALSENLMTEIIKAVAYHVQSLQV
ncbi:MAG: hypothetical protein ABR502_08830 [Chitinophagaceae bacterium]